MINSSLRCILYLAVAHETVYNAQASISWCWSWHL